MDMYRSLILANGFGGGQNRGGLLCQSDAWTAGRTAVKYACWVCGVISFALERTHG